MANRKYIPLLIIFFASAVPIISQLIISKTINVDDIQDKVFELINEERVSRGLPKLIYDSALAKVAKEWSEHLAEIEDLTHGDFEGRMATLGYEGCGEIIGMQSGPSTYLSRNFVDMWLNSEGHREIMLMPLSGSMGIGVSKTKHVISSSFYGVVDFRFNY